MAAAAAAIAAARRRRVLASSTLGAIVTLKPEEFLRVLEMEEDPLLIHAQTITIFKSNSRHRYLSSIKGLAIFCESVTELDIGHAVCVEAENLTSPSEI